MNTTETRPFNHDAAGAGAPYACANGERATILHWEYVQGAPYTTYHLVGTSGDADEPSSWTRWGRHCSGLHLLGEYSPLDLVMTPLAYIDGKAVFDGDLIIDTRGAPARAHSRLTLPGSWKWPTPAPAETRAGCAVPNITAAEAAGMAQHTVGQHEWPAHLEQHGAAAPAPAATEANRAARDMAVAETVVLELRRLLDNQPSAVWQLINRQHLAAFIARVPT